MALSDEIQDYLDTIEDAAGRLGISLAETVRVLMSGEPVEFNGRTVRLTDLGVLVDPETRRQLGLALMQMHAAQVQAEGAAAARRLSQAFGKRIDSVPDERLLTARQAAMVETIAQNALQAQFGGSLGDRIREALNEARAIGTPEAAPQAGRYSATW
jgi:hypothetical protein